MGRDGSRGVMRHPGTGGADFTGRLYGRRARSIALADPGVVVPEPAAALPARPACC